MGDAFNLVRSDPGFDFVITMINFSNMLPPNFSRIILCIECGLVCILNSRGRFSP